jgi:glucokinase
MIGVDFGGTRIKIASVDGPDIRADLSLPTDRTKEPLAILREIADAIVELEANPEAVGLAIPGEVDASGRCWRLPNVPGFEGVPFQSELSAMLGCPVRVENDATAAALGELHFGHGQRHPSFLMLALGTGVGGGVVIDGAVRRGANGFAGELGHIAIHREESWPCVCGAHGCLETYVGTAGLMREFEELGRHAEEVRDIAESARAGERAGSAVFEMMGEVLGLGICSLQNVLDVDAIVFTGGISAAFDLFEPSCRATMRGRSFAKPLAEVPLLVSELGDRAGTVGAALLPGLEHPKG